MKVKDIVNKDGFKPSPYLVDEVGRFSFKKSREQFINNWFGIKEGWAKYSETLPQAEEIYNLLMGEPKSHREWAERFNKVGEINRIIQKK